MEYSVYDLIKILLKRWYLILGVSILVAISSVFISERSYNSAVANYQQHTQQMEVQQDFGTTYTELRLFSLVRDNSLFIDKDSFIQGFLSVNKVEHVEDALDQAETAFKNYKPNPEQIQAVIDTALMDASILESAEAITTGCSTTPIAELVTLSLTETGNLAIQIRELQEEHAKAVITALVDSFVAVCAESGVTVTAETVAYRYDAIAQGYTQEAIIAQMVMVEPPTAPNIVKTVGTAAVLSFALSCFIVLIITFVKENSKKKEVPDV